MHKERSNDCSRLGISRYARNTHSRETTNMCGRIGSNGRTESVDCALNRMEPAAGSPPSPAFNENVGVLFRAVTPKWGVFLAFSYP